MPSLMVEYRFPVAGMDLSRAFWDQRPWEVIQGVWGRTTPLGVNVRGYEASTDRRRGGTRPGLERYVEDRIPNEFFPDDPDWIVQELAVVTTTAEDEDLSQLSALGRLVTLVAVSQGYPYTFHPGDDEWGTPTNNTGDSPPLNFTGIVLSAPNVEKLWFADGVNYKYYDPRTDSVEDWEASAGELPADGENNFPRLICTWRGRTVLAGMLRAPQQWHMSRVNDPTDFDYIVIEEGVAYDPAGAAAGTVAPQGQVGDIITSLCPYTDDTLIFFCDHSIYVMTGDPLAGGSIDLVTNAIGGVFGVCWCMDPQGNVWFVSNTMCVYVMKPGEQPVLVSQGIEQELKEVNTGDNVIRVAWDDDFKTVEIFITHKDGPMETDFGWTYEARTGAWWKRVYGNPYHNPVCCCQFDGNEPGDRVLLIGSWDGRVRFHSRDAQDDDGTAIESEVVLGPFLTKNLDEVMFHNFQTVLGEESGDVEFDVLLGRTAEAALSSTSQRTGSLTSGRNLLKPIQRAAHALYLRMSSDEKWSHEQTRVELSDRGPVKQRGH